MVTKKAKAKKRAKEESGKAQQKIVEVKETLQK